VALKFSGGVEPRLWPPLIDGTYAIVLTLLVIELPALTLDLLHDYNHEELGVAVLISSLLRLIGGYLGVFLVVYDIWSKKRRLLEISEQHFRISGFENFVVLFSLFLATLLPPLYYVLNQVRQDYLVHPLLGRASWLEQIEIDTVSILFLLDGVLIYVLILLGAIRRCRQIRKRQSLKLSDQVLATELMDADAQLRALRWDAALRVLLAPLIFIAGRAWLPPPGPALIYGFSGLWQTRPKPSH